LPGDILHCTLYISPDPKDMQRTSVCRQQ